MLINKLLMWHYQLGHQSFDQLWKTATSGNLTQQLALCCASVCAACCLGKLKKQPRRTLSPTQSNIKPYTRPGQCVSVDTMESRIPGFIAQLRGFLTKRQYRYTTVFVDRFFNLTYVRHHVNNTLDSVVCAKVSIKAYTSSLGVCVDACHAYNNRFDNKAFTMHEMIRVKPRNGQSDSIHDESNNRPRHCVLQQSNESSRLRTTQEVRGVIVGTLQPKALATTE